MGFCCCPFFFVRFTRLPRLLGGVKPQSGVTSSFGILFESKSQENSLSKIQLGKVMIKFSQIHCYTILLSSFFLSKRMHELDKKDAGKKLFNRWHFDALVNLCYLISCGTVSRREKHRFAVCHECLCVRIYERH